MRHFAAISAVFLLLSSCAGVTRSLIEGSSPFSVIGKNLALTQEVDGIHFGDDRQRVIQRLGQPQKTSSHHTPNGSLREAMQYCASGHTFHTVWLFDDRVIATSFRTHRPLDVFCVQDIRDIDWGALPSNILRKYMDEERG